MSELSDLVAQRIQALAAATRNDASAGVDSDTYRSVELNARADLLGRPVDPTLDHDIWLAQHSQLAGAYLQRCHPQALSAFPLNLDCYSRELADDALLALADVLDVAPIPSPVQTPLYEPSTRPGELPDQAPRIFGLCGVPRSGKDVVADYVQAHYRGVQRMAFSDVILDEVNPWLAAYAPGHVLTQANKSAPRYRHLLQAWGIGRFTEQPRYWGDRVAARVRDHWAQGARLVIVTGARLEADMQIIGSELGGEMWRVIRPGNTYTYAAGAAAQVEAGLAAVPDSSFRDILNPVEGDLAPYEDNIERALRADQRIPATTNLDVAA